MPAAVARGIFFASTSSYVVFLKAVFLLFCVKLQLFSSVGLLCCRDFPEIWQFLLDIIAQKILAHMTQYEFYCTGCSFDIPTQVKLNV